MNIINHVKGKHMRDKWDPISCDWNGRKEIVKRHRRKP